MTKLRTLIVIAPMFGICLATPAQEAPRTLKIIPVSDMLITIPPVPSPRMGVLTGQWDDKEENVVLTHREPFHILTKDSLEDLVRAGLGEITEEMSLAIRNKTLFVTGEAEHVKAAEALVGSVRQALTRRISIQARLYRIQPGQEFPAIANAERLQSLCEGLPLLWSAHGMALSGQQLALSEDRYTSYVGNAEVEVAEESKVGDPVTTTMFDGVHLIVEPHSLIGTTERVLKCQFAIGEKEQEIQDISTGIADLPRIGIPHLRANSGAFSGRVEQEGALLLSLQSRTNAGSNLLLIVQAGKLGLPAGKPVTAGNTLLLPVSAQTSSFLQTASLPTYEYRNSSEDKVISRGNYPTIEEEDAGKKVAAGTVILDLITDNLGDLLDAGASVDMIHNGHSAGYILARGPKHFQEQVRQLAFAIQEFSLGTTEVKLVTSLRSAPLTNSTFADISGPAPAAGEPVAGEIYHGATFPSLHGHTAIVLKGMESRVIRDFDVEIAQKSAIAAPVMTTTFSGLAVGFRGEQQGQDISARMTVDLQHIPAIRRQTTGQDDGGDIHHTQVHHAHFEHNGQITLGRNFPMGFGPRLRHKDEAFRMLQTVRFRKL